MDADHLQLWLQLTLAWQYDAARLKQLHHHVAGNITALRRLNQADYFALELSAERWHFFAEWQQGRVQPELAQQVERALAWSKLPGNHIIVPGDVGYPSLLATCAEIGRAHV